MTEKLYYDDPFLTRFTGKVLSCQEEKTVSYTHLRAHET